MFAYKPLLAISVFCLRVCSHTCCSFWFSFCMPLAFPSSHSKCLTCRLAVLSHRTLHASKASTKRAFAWTTSGLWSLEVGAGSPIVFFSTGCGEPSLAALVFAYLKGDVPFTDSLFTCHYTVSVNSRSSSISKPPPILPLSISINCSSRGCEPLSRTKSS